MMWIENQERTMRSKVMNLKYKDSLEKEEVDNLISEFKNIVRVAKNKADETFKQKEKNYVVDLKPYSSNDYVK